MRRNRMHEPHHRLSVALFAAAAVLSSAQSASAQPGDGMSTELCDTGQNVKVLSIMPRQAELRVRRGGSESAASVDCRLSFGDRITIPEGVTAWIGEPHGSKEHYFGPKELVYEGEGRRPWTAFGREFAGFFGGREPPAEIINSIPGLSNGAMAMPGLLPSYTQRIASAGPLYVRWQGGLPPYSIRVEKGSFPEFRNDAIFEGQTSSSWTMIKTADREPGIYQLKITDQEGDKLALQLEVMAAPHLLSAPIAIGDDAVPDLFTAGIWLLYRGGHAWRLQAISNIGLAAHVFDDRYAAELLAASTVSRSARPR